MTSRLVSVDLILTVSLRLRQFKLLPILEDGALDFYTNVREVLNHWAKQIESQGLAVSLETIAENAAQILIIAKTELLWERLAQIGDSLIEQAREIEMLILNRSVELMYIPEGQEISKAFREGKLVSFKQAVADVVRKRRDSTKPPKNSTDAKNSFKDFLRWVLDYAGEPERSLLVDIIDKEQELSTGAVELFKSRNYFPLFNALYRGK
jgi:hypothetical protein